MFFAKALRATRLRRASRREDFGCGEIDCVTAECLREMAVVLVEVPRCLNREAEMGTSESVESELILLEFIKTQRASQPRIKSLTERPSSWSSKLLTRTLVLGDKGSSLMLPSPTEVPKALSEPRSRAVPNDFDRPLSL